MAVLSKEFVKTLNDFCMMQQIYEIDQRIVVIEESSELIKELTKDMRKKGDRTHIEEEIADVLTSVFALAKELNIPDEVIRTKMLYKYNRAMERFKESGKM